MDPEQSQQPQQEEVHPLTHSYDDDLAHVMNVTEAPVVQELLADARERDAKAIVAEEEQKERKWYSVTSTILIFLTFAVVAYGAYYYVHLTIKVQPAASVGVFPSSEAIVASSTTIQQVLATAQNSTTLPLNKPTLINLVSDSSTNSLLSNSQLYSFIGANITEPMQAVMTSARLGVVNTSKGVFPFIITSVSDPEKASKEFGIAEPTLLKLFSPALGIDTTTEQNTQGLQFQSQYFYNLPVRTVTTTDMAANTTSVVFLYGYATNNIIVITAHQEALKAVYDSIITQQ